jgi:hypothetical protein
VPSGPPGGPASYGDERLKVVTSSPPALLSAAGAAEAWDQAGPDTFTVRDGVIVSTGKPTGVLRSEKRFENFVLELEWRHMQPQGNAGLFVWSGPLPITGQPFTEALEVQILDGRNGENYTSHGDVFDIQGATLKPDRPHPAGWMRRLPSKRRCKPAGEWNRFVITMVGEELMVELNGKTVIEKARLPGVAPRRRIALQHHGDPVEFAILYIRERK